VAAGIAVAVALLAVAGWAWSARDSDGPAAADLGPSSVAAADDAEGCRPVAREAAGGAGDHVDDGSVRYSAAPPSYGDHSSRWEGRALSFHGPGDRPDVSVLVHNLEHGFNILWYDQTVIDDSEAVTQLRAIADSYASLDDRRDPTKALIVAPWSRPTVAPSPREPATPSPTGTPTRTTAPARGTTRSASRSTAQMSARTSCGAG